ncbi:MAG: proton-conducting transporter membrane subunit, partial [Sediminibacterium sp.]|nr:proton-conducting transporter membrane subunit [Sediminibacterium sp.]
YIGLELLSISLIFLCTFNFYERKSSEAALKLFLVNLIASGFILYGISVMYIYNSDMTMYHFLNQPFTADAFYILNLFFIIAGFAFKLALVPFHLWAADVYEGAPTPVTNFIITVPKIAYVVFIIKLTEFSMPFNKNQELYIILISLFSILSICLGNIFALKESNIKRFLAFSSISQMGYILFGILTISNVALTNFVYFMLGYMIINFILFTIINIAETKYNIRNWEQLKGLFYSDRFTGITLLICFISLAGVPPTIGFFAKFYLILNSQFYSNWVLIIVLINLLFSMWYYFQIIRQIFTRNDSGIAEVHFEFFKIEKSAIEIGLIFIIFMGLFPSIYNYIIFNLK